jgi:hypothetical protein
MMMMIEANECLRAWWNKGLIIQQEQVDSEVWHAPAAWET